MLVPRKLIVIAIGVLAVFTIGRLAKWLGAWTDRRFFREAYDAEQVLSELSDGVRGMVIRARCLRRSPIALLRRCTFPEWPC